jgi:micrococcal nuclease
MPSRPRALAALALPLLLSLLAAGAAEGERATVTRVVDGDTLVVRLGGRTEKVRLIGVDTPESVDPRRPVEPFGKEASAFTRRLADGKSVLLRGEAGTLDRDKYGRLLRYVLLPDGTLLNAEIVRQGYGFALTRYPFARMDEFRALEREARDRGLGLWAGAAPRAPGAAATTPRPASSLPYVGSSQGHVYHRKSCEWARKIAAAHRVPFASPEEARDAGYVACRVCRPPAAKVAVPTAK